MMNKSLHIIILELNITRKKTPKIQVKTIKKVLNVQKNNKLKILVKKLIITLDFAKFNFI